MTSVGGPHEDRIVEILDKIRLLIGVDLADELNNEIVSLANDVEFDAVERHGVQIQAMIRGDLYMPEGCETPPLRD
ncbi:MAG TPA: hypothetical protein VII76_10480 [Acidimicrobiales bacterium]